MATSQCLLSKRILWRYEASLPTSKYVLQTTRTQNGDIEMPVGLKPTLYFSHANQITNYNGNITAQVAIFSPQFLYLFVYFVCKRRFVFRASSTKDIFATRLTL